MKLTLNGQPIPEKWIDYPYVRFPLSKLCDNPRFVPKYTGKDSPNKKYMFDRTVLKPGVIFTTSDSKTTYRIIRIIKQKKHLRVCLTPFDGKPAKVPVTQSYIYSEAKRFPEAEAREFDHLAFEPMEIHLDCILRGYLPYHKVFKTSAKINMPKPDDKGELRLLVNITKCEFNRRSVDVSTDMVVHLNGNKYKVEDCRYNYYPKYGILLISEIV